MLVGDSLSCRCPKCRKSDLKLYEEFYVCDVITVEGGKIAWRDQGDFPTLTGKVWGECLNKECGHRWKFRRSPLMTDPDQKNSDPQETIGHA